MATENEKDKKVSPLMKVAKGLLPYFATPAMLIYIVYQTGLFKAEIKEITFDDSRQKIKVVDHANEVPNVVENYKTAQELIKSVNKLDSTFKYQKELTNVTKANSYDAIKSRAKRDSIVVQQQKLLNLIKNDVEKINLRTKLNTMILDSLKKHN